jgi:uncharacterized phage protein (predicted DNA packaging)
MPEPITLIDAKHFLRVEHDDDDTLINALIATARLQVEARTGLDLTVDPVPEPLKQAIRLLAAHWYEHRGLTVEAAGQAPLPLTVHTLLSPYKEVRL